MGSIFDAPGMSISRTDAAGDFSQPEMGITREELQAQLAAEEAAKKVEYEKYQDPRVYEDAATPADLRKMSTAALDPLIPLGPSGETGLTGLTRNIGMPVDRETVAGAGAMAAEGIAYPAISKVAGTQRALQMAPVAGVGGAAVGSYLFDTVDAALKWSQNDPEMEIMPTLESAVKPTMEAVGSAYDEKVNQLTGKFLKVFPWLAKKGFSKLFGTDNPRTAELASLAAQHRIPLGIIQAVPEGNWVKGFTRVLGVLPYVSTPFKRSTKNVEEALSRNVFDMMDSFSPNLNASSTVSEKVVNRADEAFDLFHARSDQLFKRWFDMTKQLPIDKQAFIPTSKLRQSAQTIVDQFEAGKVGAKELRDNPLVEWARNALTFDKRLTPAQFKSQIEDLHVKIKKAAEEGVDIDSGNSMLAGMEGDLNSPALNFAGSFSNGQPVPAKIIDKLTGKEIRNPEAVSGRDIAKAVTRANTFFTEGLQRFETATAKKFRAVDKQMFKATFKEAGPQERDQLFRKLFNMDSPLGIKHLQQLVGKSNVLNGLRTVMDDAFEKGTKGLSDGLPGAEALAKVRNALGIDTKKGALVLEQALKGSNVSVDQMREVFDLVSASDSVFNPQTSSFLQRRLTLGGPQAFLPGLTAGAAAGKVGEGMLSNVAGIVSFVTALRAGSRYLTNPKNLQTMVRALDDSFAPRVRRAAIARMLNDQNSDMATVLGIHNQMLTPEVMPGDPDMGEQEDFEPAVVSRAEEAASAVGGVAGDAARAVADIAGGVSDATMTKMRAALQP